MTSNPFFTVKVLGVAWCMLLLSSVALQAQEKMPVTTVSPEAQELFTEGRDQFNMLNFSRAQEHLKKAIELDPNFALAHLFLSAAKGKATDFEEKHLNQAVELADEVSEGEKHLIHYAKASQAGNEKAIEEHRKALADLHPEDETVHLWVSSSYYLAEDYPPAIVHLTKATEINPNYHPAYNMLGYSLMGNGQMEKAEKAFKRYIELLPDHANPYDSYAEFLLRNGRFDESIAHYKKALEINPNFLGSHKGLADNYLFKGNFMMARKHYQQFGDNSPTDASKFSGLLYEASVDLHENNPEAALATIDKYIQMAEQMEQPYYQIRGNAYKGYILSETGNPQEGIQHYRKAVKMVENADLPVTMKANLQTQAQLWEFYALTSNGNMEAAEAQRVKCKNALRDHGSQNHWKTYYQIYGIMQMHKGLHEQARQTLAEAWNTPETWYYTGLTWEKQGNKTKARQWYQKVARHYQNSLELGGVRNRAMAGLGE